MATVPILGERPTTFPKLGWAWILLCLALALHVLDEALTGFLAVYNPTVIALRQKIAYWPMPTFSFRNWLTGLIVGILLLFAFTPLAFRNRPLIRPLFYLVAVVGIFNALGHTWATILGRTVSTIHFSRPAPGFYSSPFLLAASIYLLFQLRKTRPASTGRQINPAEIKAT